MVKSIYFLLAIVWCLLGIPNANAQTAIDLAYAEADKKEEARNAYYDLVLNSEIFIFATPEGEGEGDDTLQALKMRTSLFRELPLVNAFDTRDRAVEFGKARGFTDKEPIIVIEGRALFQLMFDDYWVLLNPDTAFQKFFHPDEVKMLSLETPVQSIKQPTSDLPVLEQVILSNKKLKSTLQKAVNEIPEITSVYVCEHPSDPTFDNKINYMLAFVLPSPPSKEIIDKVSPYITGKNMGFGYLDAVFLTPDRVAPIIPNATAPNFTKQATPQ